MDNSMDKYLGQLLDNRYEILEVIGTGGMAVVYKALCHRLNRYVAVKVLRDDLALDAEFRRRFQTESQAVAMLSHPNIVAVYDVSRSAELEYIVMELIEGITLKQYVKKKGALGWKESLHFITQIAKALSHAHSRGIIHRDIKPHNIMILKDGSVKVADFGIARLQESQNTMTQQALGSVHYISPEQAKGEVVDARSDIYSAGVVLYEMLTGQLPFEGESAVSVAIQHISAIPNQPREINPDIPKALETITMKAMNPDQNERYESANAMLADLEDFRKSQSIAMVSVENSLQRAAGTAVGLKDQAPYRIKPNVEPVGKSGELSKESYERRRMRSNKVSTLTGFFCVIIFILAVLIFLWNFWLKDIFSDAERINVPNFMGSHYQDIVDNKEFQSIFNFTVTYTVEPGTPEGIIVGQSPEPGKSLMLVSEGIRITLSVSAGELMVSMPNVINTDYRRAQAELTDLGLAVEFEVVSSDSITKDYIVSTVPAAGEQISAGSTVYLNVSGGPETVTFDMPNLTGMTEAAAIAELESKKLTVGTISQVESEQPIGTVIWQSPDAGTRVQEHDKVFFQVSKGPKPTPTPTETPPPTTPSQAETPVQPETDVTQQEIERPVDRNPRARLDGGA